MSMAMVPFTQSPSGTSSLTAGIDQQATASRQVTMWGLPKTAPALSSALMLSDRLVVLVTIHDTIREWMAAEKERKRKKGKKEKKKKIKGNQRLGVCSFPLFSLPIFACPIAHNSALISISGEPRDVSLCGACITTFPRRGVSLRFR